MASECYSPSVSSAAQDRFGSCFVLKEPVSACGTQGNHSGAALWQVLYKTTLWGWIAAVVQWCPPVSARYAKDGHVYTSLEEEEVWAAAARRLPSAAKSAASARSAVYISLAHAMCPQEILHLTHEGHSTCGAYVSVRYLILMGCKHHGTSQPSICSIC